MTIYNARIDAVSLGGWDGSVPSPFALTPLAIALMFEGDGWVQGSGTFSGHIEEFITQVLQTVECNDWSKLKGLHCRVSRLDGRLVAIGHIIKDHWFYFNSLYT